MHNKFKADCLHRLAIRWMMQFICLFSFFKWRSISLVYYSSCKWMWAIYSLFENRLLFIEIFVMRKLLSSQQCYMVYWLRIANNAVVDFLKYFSYYFWLKLVGYYSLIMSTRVASTLAFFFLFSQRFIPIHTSLFFKYNCKYDWIRHGNLWCAFNIS